MGEFYIHRDIVTSFVDTVKQRLAKMYKKAKELLASRGR